MPFEFLLSNHNITRDDVMRFSAKDAIRNGYWSHEELQLIVLGSLLLFIIFTFVMVATMDCVKQHCCKCLWRQRVGDKWKAPPLSLLAPPPYSSTASISTIA
ncbi:hypothetical protein RB195_013789 [Necator americanus]|uniref:Uncharacterized protein n=2 Tax=Necator americanus TaxID=51031 RepID=A0ABR1DX68_NECAM|nr:hypothetical protein NECAME_06891 [Necator americanus]ETN84329.1 hypothetical protein NECAME_06891 [Necator americanus]